MPSPAEDLHKAVYDVLVADAGVSAIVSGRVFDGRPDRQVFPCITFGPSDTIVEDYDCLDARVEVIQLDCWVRDNQRLWPAKVLADAVKMALHRNRLELATHAASDVKVIGLRCMMDPDGETAHGVVTVSAMVEEK